jgi:HD-GYP domain-containing protein (c-di-GMP phosphodiesterase class II)
MSLMMDEELSIGNAWGEVMLAWDREIAAHSSRLVRPAQATGRLLGLTRDALYRLGLAALVHDLGKMAIPQAILSKPGPLTEEEWLVMRRHPELGCSMLLHAGGGCGGVVSIVLAHHERWDGGGYPYGLEQNAIPVEARILSVVDAYDAMTSSRAYREPFTTEQARAELERCAGRQFDPQVVAAFLLVLDGEAQPQALVGSSR